MSLVNDGEFYTDGATGDMYYRTSTGLWAPVSGTAATGDVPTKQSDGTVAWAAPPGASGGTFTYYDPDKPPASASALDDEFDSGPGLDAKWTKVQFSTSTELAAFNVNSTVLGGLYVSTNHNAAGDRTHAILQALPAGDFTAVTRVTFGGKNTTKNVAGLMLADGTTAGSGQQRLLAIGNNSGTYGRVAQSANTFAGFNSTYLTESMQDTRMFLRARCSGSTYFFAWSGDGQVWFEITPSLGITPSYVGLYTANSSGVASNVAFHWFRYVASATATIGGTRTVTGS